MRSRAWTVVSLLGVSGLHTILPGALVYRPLFLLVAAGSLLCCALTLRTPDSEAVRTHGSPVAEPAPDGVERRENRLVLRLMIANMMNGAASVRPGR